MFAPLQSFVITVYPIQFAPLQSFAITFNLEHPILFALLQKSVITVYPIEFAPLYSFAITYVQFLMSPHSRCILKPVVGPPLKRRSHNCHGTPTQQASSTVVGPPLKRHSNNCHGTPTQQASSAVVGPTLKRHSDNCRGTPTQETTLLNICTPTLCPLKYTHTHSVCPLCAHSRSHSETCRGTTTYDTCPLCAHSRDNSVSCVEAPSASPLVALLKRRHC